MRIKPGKITIIVILSVATVLLALFLLVSPIAKYVIEKNSVEWTGRKITIGSLYINLFKLNITAKDLKVFEAKSNDVFLSIGRLHTGISLGELLEGTYLVPAIQIASPRVVIEQKGSHFNFDDLVERFTAVDTTTVVADTLSEPVKYYLQNVEITDGIITYRDKELNSEIVLQRFQLGCPVFAWDSPQLDAATEFDFKSGGKAKGKLQLNLDSLTYLLNTELQNLDLRLLMPYVNDLMITSYAGGTLSSKLRIKGDFDVPEAVALSGNISLAGMRIDDKAGVTVASWKNLDIEIDSLDVAGNIYNFGVISLNEPYLLFEYYDKTDNFSMMMPPSEVATSDTLTADEIDYSNPFTIMADYVKQISRDYIISNYTAENVVLHNGHIIYKDYTLEDKFVYDLLNLELASGRIDSRSDSVSFDLSCLANRSGILKAHLAFDPRDYMNMSINYSIEKMRISDFNPYSKFYVAHAFVEGMLFYNSTNTIRNGQLKSSNVMSIKKIEVSRRIKGKGLYELPLRLAISILKDTKGNIELDVPVEGDLKDPTYKLGKVIWQVLKNLVIKAATAPFNLIAKAFGMNEEDIKVVRFDYLQHEFDKKQMKSLDVIAQTLIEKPDLKLVMIQVASRESEKELLALAMAKEMYYQKKILLTQKDSLSPEDYRAIEAISNKDSLFTIWLNQQLLPEDVSILPNQLKCRKYIGNEKLAELVNKLFATRNKLLLDYFAISRGIDSTRIKISDTSDETSAQFESTPRYTVEFAVEE